MRRRIRFLLFDIATAAGKILDMYISGRKRFQKYQLCFRNEEVEDGGHF